MTAKLPIEEKRRRNTQRYLAWVKKNREKANALNYAWRKANPDKYAAQRRRALLKTKYNMTQKEFEAMAEKQEGKCAICKEFQERTLHVDHNHSTREIRGLLCTRCNTAIGLLRDNVEFLAAAIIYLT